MYHTAEQPQLMWVTYISTFRMLFFSTENPQNTFDHRSSLTLNILCLLINELE